MKKNIQSQNKSVEDRGRQSIFSYLVMHVSCN